MTEQRFPGHVWLASYPKSGNTWMRLALTSLFDGGGAIDIAQKRQIVGAGAADRGIFDYMLDTDSSDLSPEEIFALLPAVYDDCLQEPSHDRVWKTHSAWQPTYPVATTAAIVYLVRDPRDIAVSFSCHFDCSIDEAIAHMGAEDFGFYPKPGGMMKQLPQYLSSWSKNVASWIDRARPAPLVVKYEDMVRDLAAELTRVARRIGLPSTPEAISGAVEATRFDRLKKQEEREGWFSQRNSKVNAFFRRGISGGWRDSLTQSQAERIERDHGTMMERLGYL